MNRNDIIRMIREAHLDVYGLGKDHKKFMSAVESVAYSAFTAGSLAEREACAKLCETEIKPCSDVRGLAINSALNWAAENIRARGQA